MKKTISNYIYIIGVSVLMMLNLISFNVYRELYAYNYRISAVLITIVALSVYGAKYLAAYRENGSYVKSLKVLVEDKKIWLVIAANVITVVNIFITGTYLRTILVIYTFSLVLLLADKVKFKKQEIYVVTAFLSIYMVVFTVKQYGYTINFAGQIVVGSMIMLMTLIELFRLEHREIAKIDLFASIIEAIVYVWAIGIIISYGCRTSFATLLVFGAIYVWQRVRRTSARTKRGLFDLGIIAQIVFPFLYVKLKLNGILQGVTIFSKQVISGRGNVYAYFLDMIKAQPITGAGTIYVPNNTPFRAGLLDTSNAFLQIVVPQGLIVVVLIYLLFVLVVRRLIEKTALSKLSPVLFAGMFAFLVLSTGESFMVLFPFVFFYGTFLFILNSCAEE